MAAAPVHETGAAYPSGRGARLTHERNEMNPDTTDDLIRLATLVHTEAAHLAGNYHVITLVYDDEGEFQIRCTGNVNVIVGLLTRAANAVSRLKAL